MSTINLTIRPYQTSDINDIVELFKNAVSSINIRHYSPEQIAVWTAIDINKWQQTLAKNITYIAQIDSHIVGFVDMTHQGYLDRLYIHKDYQARGISFMLFKKIEEAARNLGLTKITTDCSITAKKPAERMGFKVIKEQTVARNGIELTNYVMEKKLDG